MQSHPLVLLPTHTLTSDIRRLHCGAAISNFFLRGIISLGDIVTVSTAACVLQTGGVCVCVCVCFNMGVCLCL